MAAGMGSRFGGSKQTTVFGPSGEFIVDYSIYDAIKAGFSKVVFIIKEDNYEEFKNTIGKRVEKSIKVEYVFQKLSDIPAGFNVPENRVKPWGTGHALLSCRNLVDDNFAIINADDFYGRESFITLANYLRNVDKNCKDYSMVAYTLENTLSKNGSVSRGICEVNNNKLINIIERTNILCKDNKLVYIEEDKEYEINKNSKVSVNLWGFTPMIFEDASRYFIDFFKENESLEKKEFYLPTIVKKSIDEDLCNVEVLETSSKFNGVTYKEDKEQLQKYISSLIEEGIYPSNLWD